MEMKPKRINKWDGIDKHGVNSSGPFGCTRFESMKTEEERGNMIGSIIASNVKKKEKYLSEDDVKGIWDTLQNANCEEHPITHSQKQDGYRYKQIEYDIDEVCDYIDNKQEMDAHNDYTDADLFGEDHCLCEVVSDTVSDLEFQDRESEYESEGTLEFCTKDMDWRQMYPIRKSLYNRKTHFISFLQNYTRYDMGRKLMSEYENTMCDFILDNMDPKSSQDFLKMLKECKLSNVYRFYEHIFNRRFKNFSSLPCRIDVNNDQIDKIVHIFTMFQAFFHQQGKFERKNFLSMRFLIGRIFLFVGIVKSYDNLPVDLKRPKGKEQLLFHVAIWEQFLKTLYY